jgi:hypothetical protein
MAGLLLAVLLIILIDRRDRGRSDVKDKGAVPRVVSLGLSVVTIALAAISSFWIIRTGHEGARATWNDQQMTRQESAADGD